MPIETCDPKQKPEQKFRYVDIGAINNKTFGIELPKELLGAEAPSRARRRIRSEDVLFSTVRTYLKNIAMVPKELNEEVTSTGIAVLRSSSAILPGFLFSLVRSEKFIDAVSLKQDGTLYPAITDTDLFKHDLALPPLAEQNRIVAKLDALNAKSTRARAELARIETLVSRYKQAVLSKAFSGELGTESPSKPKMKKLAEVCISVTDGDHQAPPKAPSGIPFITISAMNDGNINLAKATRFVPQSYYDELNDARRPKTGDLLYSVTGSFGIPAMVRSDVPFVFQRHIAILRPDDKKVLPEYLEIVLASSEVFSQADSIATGTAQRTVPLKGLRAFDVPVPPLEEQHEIVRRIESAFAKIDRLAAEAKRALELVGKLDEAILAKAFRGELVPQDENDEPASVLLERIRAERENAPKAKRGRGKRAAGA